MSASTHHFTTDAKPWDYNSGVSECETCEGHGSAVRFPRGAYMLNPLEWTETCEDCHGDTIIPCQVCGNDVQATGYDCIVCESVSNLKPAEMKAVNPADLASYFAQAINAALNARAA